SFTLHGNLAGALPSAAIGLKKVRGEEKQFNTDLGSLVAWEPMEKNLGMQGVAAIAEGKSVRQSDDAQNDLLLVNLAVSKPVSYWAGFAWDRAGHITNSAAWKKYLDDFARGLASPIVVTVSAD